MEDPKHVIKLTAEYNGMTVEKVIRIERGTSIEDFAAQLKQAWERNIQDLLNGGAL